MPHPPPPALLPVEEVPMGTQPAVHLASGTTSQNTSANSAGSIMCDNCNTRGHYRRNCPKIKCKLCGQLGHFRRDCPQDEAKRVRSVEEAPHDGVNPDEEYRWSVCRNCGSSRHIQANCPVRFQALECFQCHQLGHMMTTCPQTRCYNCGTFGHSSQICHSKPHCFHCSHAGHRSSECPMRFKGRVCYQCNEPGHEAANCPQGQLCRMCHRPGHLVAHCPEVVCNLCHQKGHTAGVCENVHCSNCGGNHDPTHCHLPPKAPAMHDRVSQERSASLPTERNSVSGARSAASVASCVSDDGVNGRSADVSAAGGVAVPTVVPSYDPLDAPKKEGRVAIVVDGSYFERCVAVRRNRSDPTYYQHVTDALRSAINYIGDIFQREPFAFWFDTDTTAFTEFVETSMPLAHREHAFRETAMRKRYLTDEMNSGRSLPNVVAKLVGGMKRQRGYTEDGPGHVWVQTGVDVATATCVIELFQDRRQFQQVVLLCGDADVYPAVQYCNTLRRSSHLHADANPVRVCGTSDSMSKMYGQQQDLTDFLPRLLLDRPSHTEGGRTLAFPTSSCFVSSR
ncbi:nucleic acid binding protein [Novymonas esmeraldas]|uniref:Nucleic acid binding protein n=1 Tax=Novymonas esmeraldas TaxID=1808958 RepID=A0AAW0EPQ2_9TRYP